jgi:hypothetical protein
VHAGMRVLAQEEGILSGSWPKQQAHKSSSLGSDRLFVGAAMTKEPERLSSAFVVPSSALTL